MTFGSILSWIIIGGIVGWIVSLFLGRDFKGGCLAYVAIGIITMIVIGCLVRILWVLIAVALVIVIAAWVLDLMKRS